MVWIPPLPNRNLFDGQTEKLEYIADGLTTSLEMPYAAPFVTETILKLVNGCVSKVVKILQRRSPSGLIVSGVWAPHFLVV